MFNFGSLMDNLERTMAAVAFAEANEPETAVWILKSESSKNVLRVTENIQQPVSNRPEMRL